MLNAVGHPRKIVVLGGTSDIALSVVEEYLASGPLQVVLAARQDSTNLASSVERLETAGAHVSTLNFDAADFDGHPHVIEQAFSDGDVDLAIIAFGLLGDAEQLWQDQAAAVEAAQVNYTGAVSVGVLLGQAFKAQGHGTIVALSSVAGERVRRSNFVYGSTKAGMDAFYLNLGEALADFGVNVLVVRPGQVRTKMVAGMKEAPLTADAAAVARAIVDAVRERKRLIWTPKLFQLVMMIIKHIPQPIFRKLPF